MMNFEAAYRMAAAVTSQGGGSVLAHNMTRTLSLKKLIGVPIKIKSAKAYQPADTGYALIACGAVERLNWKAAR